jgi:hypothetical protein
LLPLGVAAPAQAAKRKVKAIAWEGRAHVSVGGRELDLVSRTSIEMPLLFVRSTSWIAGEGPEKARTMVLEPADAWVEVADARRPCPRQLALHERQQYAIYALLLIVQSRNPKPGSTLNIFEPPFPEIRFEIGSDGFPAAAELTVEAPESGKPDIREQLTFRGRIENKGVRWPRSIAFTQDGKPYFTLDIDTFSVEFA